MPPQPRQQSRFNEIQMLQRQIMFKQLQELQRQQKIQELGDARQQNYINQQALINKQASGTQFSPLINGTPVHDASQMFMFGNTNMGQHGTSQLVHGFPNGLVYSQAQNQALHAMGLVPQQLDGTPVASAGNNFSQYSQFQGASHDTARALTKQNSDQAEKSVTQSSAVSKSYMNDQSNVSSNQEKNLFGQVFTQNLDSGVQSRNFQQVNSLQRNASLQQLGGRQEQVGRSGLFSGKTANIGPSQGLDSLDPLEQKILFNMDDNNMGTGGFGNMFEQADHLGAFPSVQSGSWSALMQSAVAEASSNDTCVQEEWSGLSFQNPELSNDNQPSNFVESGKQPTYWVDNNLQSASSLSSKPEFLYNNSNVSSSFPGFQNYSGTHFPFQLKEDIRSDSSHDSIQKSPKKETLEGSEPVQRLSRLQSAWPGKSFEHLQSDAHQPSMSTYTNNTQPFNRAIVNEMESQSPSDRENFELNHFTNAPNSSKTGVDRMYHSDRRSNAMTSDHLQLCNSPRVAVSTYKGASDAYGSRENSFQRENSIGSYHSNTSQHTIAGPELKDDEHLQESDSYPVSEGDQKPSGQVRQTPNDQEQGHAGEFEFIGNASNSAMDFQKRFLPDIQRNFKPSEEATRRSNVSSGIPAFFDRSGFPGPNSTAQTSHNMLELLHKVDKFTEYGPQRYFGSADSTPMSEVPQAEHAEASFTQSNNKSSTSQYFGLRLAPPVQRLPNTNYFESSQISPQMDNSSKALLGPKYDGYQLHNQVPVTRQSPQATLSGIGSRFPGFNPAATYQEASHLVSANPYGQGSQIFEAKQITQPPTTSGMSQQVAFTMRPPNVWIDVPTQQNPSALGAQRELDNQNYLKGENSSQEIGAHLMSSQGFDYNGGQPTKETSMIQTPGQIRDPISQIGQLFHSQELISGHNSEANAVASDRVPHSGIQPPAISVRDLEAFGRSLNQSHVSSQRIPLLSPMHSDPNSRVAMKNTRVDSDMKIPQQLNSYTYGDNKIFPVSSAARADQSIKTLAQPLLQDTCQDMVTYNKDDVQSHANAVASNETERPQTSFPTSPAWFKNYGTLKNGQMLPIYDARVTNTAGKPFESFYINSSAMQVNLAGESQFSSVLPATGATSVTTTHLSSPPNVLHSDVIDQNLVVLKPKKRKFPTFELLPWHKEMTQGSSRLQNISSVELEWSQATNRLTKKLKDEAEAIEDSHPTVRPKRRLTLTTQLMQLLFRPAPAVILSEDATLHCDTVAYFAARLALGDACGLASHSQLPCDISDLSSGKDKTSESIGDQDISKIVENFINRSKRLEGDLLRLEEGGSILDIRLESQELATFSVINRFAKFHIRGQVGPAEATSSATASTMLKLSPQRYVTASPMPKTVPEGAQCLSL